MTERPFGKNHDDGKPFCKNHDDGEPFLKNHDDGEPLWKNKFSCPPPPSLRAIYATAIDSIPE